jgi:ADP-dependent NAD(P)H-hydrate dehydratase / NAD(P)H-hydrate epimerase
MKPVLTVSEMREVDAEALRFVSESVLVERAGTAVATWALRTMGGSYGRRVVVVAGKGNNGADGRIAADRLRSRGARVTIFDASDAPKSLGGDTPVDLVIDAAYGTGFRGDYRAPSVPTGVPVLAVDIPSGVDGDTGAVSGEALRADLTVTFAALKPGLLQGDGPVLAGQVEVADIGLDATGAHIWLVEDNDVDRLVPKRRRDAYKWQAAAVVVAGSPGMFGAAALCARSAYRAGAGMVRLGVPGADIAAIPAGEAVGIELPRHGWSSAVLDVAKRCGVVVIGPGIGREPETAADVRAVAAESPVPVVLDADALFALGDPERVAEIARQRSAASGPLVLTPHSGEYAQMFGHPPGADRIATAIEASEATGAVFLLKGPTTVVARARAGPAGNSAGTDSTRVRIVTAGSPSLATAGTGDVLSGAIGAFIARGTDPFEAAALAAHVHGRAAGLGPAEGLIAEDLADLIAKWLSSELHSSDRGGRGTGRGHRMPSGASSRGPARKVDHRESSGDEGASSDAG